MTLCRQAQPPAWPERNDFDIRPSSPVTQPDLLLKPVAGSPRFFLTPVRRWAAQPRPAAARAMLANGERPHSISR